MTNDSRTLPDVARWLAVVAVLAGAALPEAQAASSAYKPGDRSCRPATPDQLAWLTGDDWKARASAVRFCAVARSAKSAPGLLIASVSEDAFYATRPSGSVTVPMPHPQLFAPDGRRLGELPKNFPVDEAETLRLVFTDWRGAVPGEIRLCVISPGVGGNYILPSLRLDATGDHYATEPGPMRAPSKRDDCAGQ